MRDLANVVPMRSVLIFGGAGFIGSNWAHRLLKTGAGSDRLQLTIGDIRDASLVERAVQKATEIYHFAAQVAVTNSVEDPRFDLEVNVGGTFNILEAARKSSRHPFLLFTSTNKVYGSLGHRQYAPSVTRYLCTEHD